ncbi:hypothetical protein [Sphingomonas sp. M1-B02]|uniref:hypothetical protein n=1 Tax=Sphingomonas sp. M1-B02 TaxID=3114300 RepID=UPI00223F4E2E|nr:hypothetical protein [Sphingomonas sp. S6-11]UZK65103.1 hypothetical protein OKW87_11315 [Sphingomonas sp. S6-11]
MLKRFLLAATVASIPMLAPATAQAQNSQQTRSANAPIGGVLTVFGDDRCPSDVICVRAPESERYRIPQNLREQPGAPQQTESWAVRSGDALDAGRMGTGSCTTVGASGSTGCFVRQARQSKAEANARKEAANNLPLP